MNFKVGEYKTESGCKARIRFIISEPTDATYPLIGEVLDDGYWKVCSWNRSGKRFGGIDPTAWDLVPNKVYVYYVLTKSSIGTAYYEEPTANYLKVERLPNGDYDWAHATIVVRYA